MLTAAVYHTMLYYGLHWHSRRESCGLRILEPPLQ